MSIEIKDMDVLDFLTIMAANVGVQPEYDNATQEQKIACAKANIGLGTAKSYFEAGKLIGVMGIRYICLGEAWGISTPELRKEQKHTLFKLAKTTFDETVKEHNLLRVFAVPTLSENFIEHLGFDSAEQVMVWHRKAGV